LTGAFFWIPSAGLSAIIIAAVGDLVAPPRAVYNFWRVNPLECIIWWAAVLVTVFSSIENGIYTSICASAALLIIRIARPHGHFLGRVLIHRGEDKATREIYVPLDDPRSGKVLNPHLKIEAPAPGVLIYRPEESVLYPNSSLITGELVDHIKTYTRRGRDMTGVSLNDRPWNDPGPRNGVIVLSPEERAKPILRSVVFDFAAVSSIDTTAVQALIDTRAEIERWADREVTFHFAHILSPWIRRGLVAGGFGLALTEKQRARLPVELAPIIGRPTAGDDADGFLVHDVRGEAKDVETGNGADIQPSQSAASSATEFEGSVVNRLTPYFHFDISSAVHAAEREAALSDGSPVQDSASIRKGSSKGDEEDF